FRNRVTALEADVMSGALLESNLHRVVPGVRDQSRKPFEVTVELRVGTKQIRQRKGGVAVLRIGFVENRGTRVICASCSAEQRTKRVRNRSGKRIGWIAGPPNRQKIRIGS